MNTTRFEESDSAALFLARAINNQSIHSAWHGGAIVLAAAEMGEWDALELVLERLMDSGYKLRNDERDALYVCESEIFWRSGTGLILSTASLVQAAPKILSTPLGMLITVVSGFSGGRTAAEPCLRSIMALEKSLLAIETRQCLYACAPER